jgi:hypothetical protein
VSPIREEADTAITRYLDANPDRGSAYHRDAEYHQQVETTRTALADVADLLQLHGDTIERRAHTLRVLLASTGEPLTTALDACDVHATLPGEHITALRHAVHGAAGVMAGAHYDAVTTIGRIMAERGHDDTAITRLCTVLLDGPGDHTAALARARLRDAIAADLTTSPPVVPPCTT